VRIVKALLLALAMLLLTAAGSAAAGPGKVSWAQFFLARPAGSSAAPGLPLLTSPSDAASTKTNAVPSIASCVKRWNTAAPSRTRKWIATRAHVADVTVRQTAVRPNGTTKTVVVSQCAYAVVVGAKQLLLGVAPVSKSDGWSGELLRYHTVASLTKLRKGFNATVRTGGSLRLG
jgi:hypothetical protein